MHLNFFLYEPMQLRVRWYRNRVKFEYNEWLWIVIYKKKKKNKQKQQHWPQNWALEDSISYYYPRIAGHWRCISFITHVDEGHNCRVILERNPDWYLLAWRFHIGSFRGDRKTVFLIALLITGNIKMGLCELLPILYYSFPFSYIIVQL